MEAEKRAQTEKLEAEAIRVQEQREKLARRIEESKRTGQTLATFSGFSPSDGYEYTLDLTITDAGVKRVYKTGKYRNSRKTGTEEWFWFGDKKKIKKGQVQFIWNGLLARPSVSGAGGAFFDDELQQDKYYQALSAAFRAWQEKFPDVVAAGGRVR